MRGLDTGADDYVTKPFSPERAASPASAPCCAGSGPALAETLQYQDLVMDLAAHRVTRDGREVHLGPTEFRLLRPSPEHPGRVFSREQLLDMVWGPRRLCRAAHGGRAYPAPAQGDQRRRGKRFDPHRARRRLRP